MNFQKKEATTRWGFTLIQYWEELLNDTVWEQKLTQEPVRDLSLEAETTRS